MDGASVATRYSRHSVLTPEGKLKYSFAEHSAGPFGEDILGKWLSGDDFRRLLEWHGGGWVDIHATQLKEPSSLKPLRLFLYKHLIFRVLAPIGLFRRRSR